MADPSISDGFKVHASAESKMDKESTEDGLVLVKEGYFRYIDILFEWCKYMNPWQFEADIQKNAVKALLNGEALTHPDHPLHVAGNDGVELYLSTAQDGKQALLFSLKQIEYLQYYIHHHRLADPRVVKQLTNIEGSDKPWPADFDFDSIAVEEWIPLPMNVLLPSVVGEVKPIILPTLGSIKRAMTRVSKHNKAVKREAMIMRGTPQEKTQAEAELDNEREGPGLRSGPRKHSWQTKRDDGLKGAGEESGWGGGWDDEPAVPHHPKAADTIGANEPFVKVDLAEDVELDRPTSPASETTTNLATPPRSPFAAGAIGEVPPDTPAEHYVNAEQAVSVAAAGGLFGALSNHPEHNPSGEPNELQKQVGRSLFLALDLETYEKDERLVLEIGWSATWWQPEDPEDLKGEFEQYQDNGHYIIQDHLLTFKNGEIKPNHRDDFLYGNSIPIREEDIGAKMDRLIADLSAKAGGGPIYMVVHSSGSDWAAECAHSQAPEHAKFIKIGLYSVDWIDSLRPTGEWPAYSCESGIGQVFVIDTAKLFANVDESARGDEVGGKSPITLEEVWNIIYPAARETVPKYGNAGNRAACTMAVFLRLVLYGTLDDWRKLFKASFVTEASAAPVQAKEIAESPVSDFEAPEPVTFVRPSALVDGTKIEDDEESEDDGEGDIKGVYFETEDGEIQAFDDSDDDNDKV